MHILELVVVTCGWKTWPVHPLTPKSYSVLVVLLVKIHVHTLKMLELVVKVYIIIIQHYSSLHVHSSM